MFQLTNTAIATQITKTANPTAIAGTTYQLFHILFQDEKHKGDHHLRVTATDAIEARKKCERVLNSKHADQSTIQVMSEKTYRKKYPIARMVYYVFYHNGRPRYCPIMAINSVQAAEIFFQRFGFKPESVMDKETFVSGGKTMLRDLAAG